MKEFALILIMLTRSGPIAHVWETFEEPEACIEVMQQQLDASEFYEAFQCVGLHEGADAALALLQQGETPR